MTNHDTHDPDAAWFEEVDTDSDEDSSLFMVVVSGGDRTTLDFEEWGEFVDKPQNPTPVDSGRHPGSPSQRLRAL